MQERRDGALLVEPMRGGKRQHVDADQLAVGAGFDQPLDGRRRIGIGHIAQRREQGFGTAHAPKLTAKTVTRECPCTGWGDRRRARSRIGAPPQLV